MTLDIVAFDIETTGFTAADEVTVAGFALEMGARVFYQTGEQQPGNVERAVRDESAHNVHVSVHESEHELLESMAAFVTGRLAERDVLVVAYNGETWRGGFDLPFLRTRLAAHDVAWPFTDVAYGDVLPVITDRFNTTVPDPDAGRATDEDTASDEAGGAPGMQSERDDGDGTPRRTGTDSVGHS